MPGFLRRQSEICGDFRMYELNPNVKMFMAVSVDKHIESCVCLEQGVEGLIWGLGAMVKKLGDLVLPPPLQATFEATAILKNNGTKCRCFRGLL